VLVTPTIQLKQFRGDSVAPFAFAAEAQFAVQPRAGDYRPIEQECRSAASGRASSISWASMAQAEEAEDIIEFEPLPLSHPASERKDAEFRVELWCNGDLVADSANAKLWARVLVLLLEAERPESSL
jgi:hypothetical protein